MSRSSVQTISLHNSIFARLFGSVAFRILDISSVQVPMPVPSSHVDGLWLGCKDGRELGSLLGDEDGEELGIGLGNKDGILEGNTLGPCEGCLSAIELRDDQEKQIVSDRDIKN